MSLRERSEKRAVMTAELFFPVGTDVNRIVKIARSLSRKGIDAFNVPDNPCSKLNISSLGLSAILFNKGIDPVMQMTCRDRNLLALRSDLLGAYALGIRNVLVLTGDAPKKGEKAVFEVDSVGLLKKVKRLEKQIFLSGSGGKSKDGFFFGAVVNQNAENPDFEITKMKRKIRAGAEFFQTQPVFNVNRFRHFMHLIKEKGIKTRIIAGVLLLDDGKKAERLDKIPGIHISHRLIWKMRHSRDPVKTDINFTVELVRKLQKYCDGIHFMPMGKYEMLKEVLKRV